MDVKIKICVVLLLLLTFSALKCEGYYCLYTSYSYTDTSYYCRNYDYEDTYTLSGGAIAGIVIGCLVMFALGFGILIQSVLCGALGAACKRQPSGDSTIAVVQSQNSITTHDYNQQHAPTYGIQPMVSPLYDYTTTSITQTLQTQNQAPGQPKNHSIEYLQLPTQNSTKGLS